MTLADWLAWIEQMRMAQALRTSFHAYPLLNAVHIAAIGALVTSVFLIHAGRGGMLEGLDAPATERLFSRIAFCAIGAVLATGFLLFSVKPAEYAANPAFLWKMALLGIACLNFLAWRFFAAWRAPGTIASLLLWPAVLVAGRYIGFV